MVSKDLAEKANKLFVDKIYRTDSLSLYDRKIHCFDPAIFDNVKGTVIYVGCGRELSPLFLFENASTLIYQDLGYPNLYPAFKILKDNNIISDVEIINQEKYKTTMEIVYKDKVKKIIEIHGGADAKFDHGGSQGDIAFTIPDETKEDLEVMCSNSMPYWETTRVSLINLLGLLKIGGLVHGFSFHPKRPEEYGLTYAYPTTHWVPTYVKQKEIAKKHIEELLGYSVKKYIEYLLHLKKGMWRDAIIIHPLMEEKALSEGFKID